MGAAKNPPGLSSAIKKAKASADPQDTQRAISLMNELAPGVRLREDIVGDLLLKQAKRTALTSGYTELGDSRCFLSKAKDKLVYVPRIHAEKHQPKDRKSALHCLLEALVQLRNTEGLPNEMTIVIGQPVLLTSLGGHYVSVVSEFTVDANQHIDWPSIQAYLKTFEHADFTRYKRAADTMVPQSRDVVGSIITAVTVRVADSASSPGFFPANNYVRKEYVEAMSSTKIGVTPQYEVVNVFPQNDGFSCGDHTIANTVALAFTGQPPQEKLAPTSIEHSKQLRQQWRDLTITPDVQIRWLSAQLQGRIKRLKKSATTLRDGKQVNLDQAKLTLLESLTARIAEAQDLKVSINTWLDEKAYKYQGKAITNRELLATHRHWFGWGVTATLQILQQIVGPSVPEKIVVASNRKSP